MSDCISQAGLRGLVDQWLAAGRRVVGPTRVEDRPGAARFAALTDSGQLLLAGFTHPVNTAKECVLPKSEKLYEYVRAGQQVQLREPDQPPVPTLLIGCRPCDAAAFPIMDAVMSWDFRDSQYHRRRAALTVVTLACSSWDEHCFCTSVGLGPAAERGSDALLLELPDGSYQVRVLTDTGQRTFSGHLQTSDQVADPPVGPEPAIDFASARQVLAKEFDNPIWAEVGLRCLGCGSCTYTCPTCHCFDIVDEPHGAGGCRVRNWDSCQFAGYTAHASGHNPRPDQAARQRQRYRHKLVTYPEKFGDYLCTGCGNCHRNCPVGLGTLPVLRAAGIRPPAAEG